MEELNNLRIEIDFIDREIIELLAKRFKVVKKIGEIKKLKDFDIIDKTRWDKVLDNIKNIAKKNNLDENFIKNIYNLIHKYAINLEKKV